MIHVHVLITLHMKSRNRQIALRFISEYPIPNQVHLTETRLKNGEKIVWENCIDSATLSRLQQLQFPASVSHTGDVKHSV